MRTRRPTMNSFKGSFSEEMTQFLNSIGIRRTMQDLHLLSSSNRHFNYQLGKITSKKKNEKSQNLLSKFLTLLDFKMIFTSIYLTGVLIMRQELGLGKQFLSGMQGLEVFLAFVRAYLLSEMTKKIILDNNLAHRPHFTQVLSGLQMEPIWLQEIKAVKQRSGMSVHNAS